MLGRAMHVLVQQIGLLHAYEILGADSQVGVPGDGDVLG